MIWQTYIRLVVALRRLVPFDLNWAFDPVHTLRLRLAKEGRS